MFPVDIMVVNLPSVRIALMELVKAWHSRLQAPSLQVCTMTRVNPSAAAPGSSLVMVACT